MPISSALGKVGLGGLGTNVECLVFSFFLGLCAGAFDTKPRSQSCMVDDSFIREKEIDLGTELDPCLHYELRSTTFETKRSTTQRNTTQRNTTQHNATKHNATYLTARNANKCNPMPCNSCNTIHNALSPFSTRQICSREQ
jgi:hypothetical protein